MALAAVLRQLDGPFGIEEVDLDDPRPGEARVRIVASGMCHTDLSMRAPFRNTALPAVLGHEGAGIVEAVGAGVDVRVGQPVVLSYSSCGACRRCHDGEPGYCDTMWPRNFGLERLDGSTSITSSGERVGSHFFGQSSFATHVVADARCLVPVGDDVDLVTAAPLGCGVQTGAGVVLNTLRPRPGDSFAVLGAGSVGLSALLAADVAGCGTRIAVDLHPGRLALARELGATDIIPGDVDDLAAALLDATNGRGVDHIFDTTGLGDVVGAAVQGLAVRGAVALVAAKGPDVMMQVPLRHMMSGRRIHGVIEGDSIPQVFIPELLALHRAGRFPYDRLITRFDLADINAAEAASHDGSVIKPVLVMPS